MAVGYQTGEKTKEKILNVSRRLFYEKGFDDATYDDISGQAGINRALIPYYFKSKRNLGAVIYEEFISNLYEIKAKLTKKYKPAVATSVLTFMYYETLKDENTARFIYQLQKEQSFRERFLLSEKTFITGLLRGADTIDSESLDILSHLDYGIEREIVEMMYTGVCRTRLTEVAGMEIHIMLNYIGYKREEILEILTVAKEIAQSCPITVGADFKIIPHKAGLR